MDLNRLKIDRGSSSSRARRRRSPWLKRGIIAVVVFGLLWLFRQPLIGAYERLTLPEVDVVVAVKTDPRQAAALSGVAANGYVVAARRAALSADTPGRIVAMNVEEGSVVKAGDVVARLYSKEYAAALRRAEADLSVAEAAVSRAEADENVAAAAVERAQAEVAAARESEAAARTDVPAAEERVADAQAAFERTQTDLARGETLLERGAETQQVVDDARTRRDRAKAILNAARAAESTARARVREAASRVTAAQGAQQEAAARRAAASAAVNQARARVEVATATRDEARAILEKTEVRAPFDGVVVLKDAEVGEVVSPNSQGASSRGSVVTMVDFDSLEVQVDLPETSLAGIEEGVAANIFLDAYPADRYAGVVSRVWPTANRQKGTVELRIRFDRPDDRLRPEMGARVVFPPRGKDGRDAGRDAGGEFDGEADGTEAKDGDASGEPARPAVVVPESAVVRQDGRSGVFLVERGRVRFVAVGLGETRGTRVVVEQGREGGERLVDAPGADVEDGMRVRVPGEE